MVKRKQDENEEELEERQNFQSNFIKQSIMAENGIADPNLVTRVIAPSIYHKMSYNPENGNYTILKHSRTQKVPFASIHNDARKLSKTKSVRIVNNGSTQNPQGHSNSVQAD